MFSQLHRYQLATLCCLLVSPASNAACSAAAALANHPLSYTEAWVTVSDRIEVKLRLFTDDMIRYDRKTDPLPESLSADDFNRILERQTPELLRRIQLYVGGKRLTGKVTSVPAPWSSSDVIEVAGAANVKHTWSFEFQIPNRPVRSLTIRHSLSPPGIDQLGELRLHSRHKLWKQRIDAVIPADLSYTVVYREAGNSTAATATANQTTSRIIVSPFAVTHEFTLPLTNVLSAFPDLKQSIQTPDGTEAQLLSIRQQQQLSEHLREWIQQNTIVAIEGKPIVKQKSTVQFFESGIIPEQPVRDANPSPVRTPGTLVGIRQTYARWHTQEAGSLILKSAFPNILEIRCETIFNNTANTSLQSTNDDSAEGQMLHKWSTQLAKPQSDSSNHWPAAVSNKLISQKTLPGRPQAWWLISVGLGLILLTIASLKWSGSQRGPRKLATAMIVIGLAIILAGFVRRPATIDQPVPDTIHSWMSAALKTIYQSLKAPSEQQTVQKLSEWLSDEMVESTYLTVCQQMVTEPEQATWTGIQAVNLARMTIELNDANALRIFCEWEVEGMTYHWGHAHQVMRRYSGEFALAKTAANWKIRELTQLQAKAAIPLP